MSFHVVHRWKRQVVIVLSLLQIFWPLDALTVYAAETPPALAEDGLAETEAYPLDTFLPLTEISDSDESLADFYKTGPHTIVYNKLPIDQVPNSLQINVYPYVEGASVADINAASQAGDINMGRMNNNGFYTLSGSNAAYLVRPEYYLADDEDASSSVLSLDEGAVSPPTAEDISLPTCEGEEPSPFCALFQINVSGLNKNLGSIGATERRLKIDGPAGEALMFGEDCEDDGSVLPANDTLVNGKCDATPRVDARLILMLDYLLREKSEGGAGREYIQLAAVGRFGETEELEDVDYESGVADKCVVDPQSPADDPAGISTCLQIKAIDKMRITTRIKKYGVFGTSTKYRYKAPLPIQVAWQTESGQANTPLPAISTEEMISNFSTENLLTLLEQEDFLADPDFNGQALENVSLGDIARFLGSRLLKQLLDGQNILKFNFGETIEDFGILVLAGALNIDPLVLRNANSIEDIESAQGRVWVAKQIGLDNPLNGLTTAEVFRDVARQQIAKLLDIKPYVFEGEYSAGEFMERLGQGSIEMHLPVPEKSFSTNDLTEVLSAISINRFDYVFGKAGFDNAEARMAEIDERLGTPIGTTKLFIEGGDVSQYKKAVGAVVWEKSFGKYSDNQAQGFAPEHPAVYFGRLITDPDAQPVGDLTLVVQMTNPDDPRSLVGNGIGLDGDDMAAQTVLLDRVGELYSRLLNIQNKLQAVIDSQPCDRPRYYSGSPLVSCYNSANETYSLIDARLAAIDRMPKSEYEDELDAIARRADQIFSENAWKNDVVLQSSYHNQSRYSVGVMTSLNTLATTLGRIRDHIADYREYGSNADGSGQRVDQMMNLPAGTVYKIMNGGADAQEALMGAGIRTIAQYLPTDNDRSRFEMYASSSIQGTYLPMVITDSKKQYLADVFLSLSPDNEFRRLGRRILIDNVSDSAEVEQLKQTEFWSKIDFYRNRYETIVETLNTIRTESDNLLRLTTGLPEKYQTYGTHIRDTSSELLSLFHGVDLGDLTFSSAKGLVSEKKEKFYEINDSISRYIRDFEKDANGLTGAIERSTNNLLGAARVMEQAIMEIIEGRPLVVEDSNIPKDIDIPDLQLTSFGEDTDGKVKTSANNCSYKKRQMSVLMLLYGDLMKNKRPTDYKSVLNRQNLQQVLITLGSTKLAELLGLPMESFIYFSQVEEKNADSFFLSVGRGLKLSQCQDPNRDTDEELIESGRNYVIAHALTSLASNIGVKLPAWANENLIVKMMLGQVDEVLFAVGSAQAENLLELPAGSVERLVRPTGTTEVARSEERQRAIIDIVLSKLNVELDLPAGFTLTDDPILSMGLARIEGLLGFDRGRILINKENKTASDGRTGDTASWSFSNLVDTVRSEIKSGADYEKNDAEISVRTQLIAGFGMPLPIRVADMLGSVDEARKEYLRARASNDIELYSQALTQLETRQMQVLDILQADNDGLFAGEENGSGPTTYGIEQYLYRQPNTDNEDEIVYADGYKRLSSLDRRLTYMDQRMGLEEGTTEQWLNGQITTEQLARMVGSGAAKQLTEDAFLAFLRRIGTEGPWYDMISSRTKDSRTGYDNLELLGEVVLGNQPLNGAALAQIFTMMGQAMSFNLDEEANFEIGTIANIIANPLQGDKILFDQGVRIFAEQVLHFNISENIEKGKTLKRLASAIIYGATYNQETGRFEGVSISSDGININLNGAAALNAALFEMLKISQEWIAEQIGEEEWRFFQVPIKLLFLAVFGIVEGVGGESEYVSLARSQNELRQRINAGLSNETDVTRVDDMGYYNSNIAAVTTPNLPPPTSKESGIFGISSLDQFITSDNPKNLSSVDYGLTEDERNAITALNAEYVNASSTGSHDIDYSTPDGVSITAPTDWEKQNAKSALNKVGKQYKQVSDARSYWMSTAQTITKLATYAAIDYGLDRVLDLPKGVIQPNMAMTLFEGSTSQKVDLFVSIGISYALAQGGIPEDMQFLFNYDNVKQSLAFFLNIENRGQLLAAAFSPGGVFDDLQQYALPHGLFGEIGLPQGTFAALIGYAITGHTRNFFVDGVEIKGLSNLFGTEWLLEIGFKYVSKLLKIKEEVLINIFKLSYDFYKAFEVWNTLCNTEIEVIAAEITATNPGFSGDPIKAAEKKIESAHDAMASAAIKLVIYILDLAFGDELAVFETAIGLPPGTILQGTSLFLTAIFIGTGPMFFASLGIFLVMTIFGFGYVKTTIRATADGYYPLSGALGQKTTAGQNGMTYSQYPSSDALDNEGTVIATRALGEFDPLIESRKKEGFMKASRQKVKGVVLDLVNQEQIIKYLTTIGLLTDNMDKDEQMEMLELMEPNQILLVNDQESGGNPLYIGDPDIIRANRTYFNATGENDASGYCNVKWPAGICSGEPGQLTNFFEVSY